MSDLDRIADAIEMLDNNGQLTVTVELSNEDYYVAHGIFQQLERIANALEKTNNIKLEEL